MRRHERWPDDLKVGEQVVVETGRHIGKRATFRRITSNGRNGGTYVLVDVHATSTGARARAGVRVVAVSRP